MDNRPALDNALTQNADSQSQMTPAIAKTWLEDGNERFMAGAGHRRNHQDQINITSTGQWPFAVVLSCIDSRIPTEIIFDQGIGDIFNARIAGNFVNDDILGSMEFACKLAGSKLIVVMGHTSCGAVKGACDNAKLGNLTQMLDKIMPAVNAVETAEGADRSSANINFVNAVALENVKMTIGEIRNRSQVLADQESNDEIEIVGAMYDVQTGRVTFYD